MIDTIRRRAVYLTDIDRPHKCGPTTCRYPACGLRQTEDRLDAKENAVSESLGDPNGDARAISLAVLAAFLVGLLVLVMGSR